MGQSGEVYVHLGDAEHRPMLTLLVTGRRMFNRILRDCKREKWPYRVQVVE